MEGRTSWDSVSSESTLTVYFLSNSSAEFRFSNKNLNIGSLCRSEVY